MSDPLSHALRLHQAGDLRGAESVYRTILQQKPEDPDALHLLGVVAHQTSNHAAAVGLIRRAIAVRPGEAAFHGNLGEALRADGDIDGAIGAYEVALALNPGFTDALGNLGAALASLGRSKEAIERLRRAVEIAPDFLEAWMNLGDAYRALGRFDDAAVSFREALRIQPALVEAHVNLGNALKETGDRAASEQCYRAALGLRPEMVAAHMNLANTLAEQDRFEEARASYHRAFQLQHGGVYCNAPALEAAESAAPPQSALAHEMSVTRFELRDRLEHLEYLLRNDKLDRSFGQLAERYHDVLAAIGESGPANDPIALSKEQSESIATHYRAVRYADVPRIKGPVVNPDLALNAIEETYLASPTAVIHIDQFLTGGALRAIREFCLESTIFFGRDRAGTLQSYVGKGFDCHLLFQVVEELKCAFPRILGSQELHNMWVYRYAAVGEGVRAHTDEGAVTFNFWLTPDDANLEPDTGGLVVYTKEQPLDWDWLRFNRDKDSPAVQAEIERFLGSAETVTIPYRENRAVLFHSNLFHRSDRFRFREGYQHRRMNVTLLFGERGTDARSAWV